MLQQRLTIVATHRKKFSTRDKATDVIEIQFNRASLLECWLLFVEP